MRLSTQLLPLLALFSCSFPTGLAENLKVCDTLPINSEDFDQPDWVTMIETAFPPWDLPTNFSGCPRLDKVGGTLMEGYESFPLAQANKFNPCYFTKAFAGLDPKLGGYPTPIDTKYPYEFAAPFFKQPGDGSVHHCPIDSDENTKIQSCPKIYSKCPGDVKDCVVITDEFGIGHIPPFVPLAAIKNAYLDCAEDVCNNWFDDDIQPCNIKKSVLDGLVYDSFGVNGTIQFTPPIVLPELPPTDRKSTYYKLEYVNDPIACMDDNCRGPHYCSKEAAKEDIWGDFCPYIHTGDNSGLYRHPHVALAALELWIANKCKPDVCPSTWLDSPNGKSYIGADDDMKSTSITWAETEDNDDPMAQPKVPYKWPNSGNGLYPGHELYGGFMVKPAGGSYVNKFVAKPVGNGEDTSEGVLLHYSSFMAAAVAAFITLSFV